LTTYFTRTYSAASRTPTRSVTTTAPSPSPTLVKPATHHSIAGPVAGGVVGGVVVLALLACIFCIRRRRRAKQRNQETVAPQSGPMLELPAPESPASPHKRNISGSTTGVVSPTAPSPPPPPFDASHWSPQAQNQQTYLQYGPQAPQQYYPPPPQAQPYYPPPPASQHQEEPPSPILEMPSIRSPLSGVSGGQVR